MMNNQCIECGKTFEPTESLWLFCDVCDRERHRAFLKDISRILNKAKRDPDYSPDLPEINKTQADIMGRIYAL